MIGAVELGLIYGLMALGVYLTFRILDFADLTIDSSFTTGAAACAVVILGGGSPWLGTLAGFAVGLIAGLITGLLNTAGKIHPLLAGILTQIGLYSVNLRIMGKSNLPFRREESMFTPLREANLVGTWVSVAILLVVLLVACGIVVWFLSTNLGLALRATGDNEEMARAQGVNTDLAKLGGAVRFPHRPISRFCRYFYGYRADYCRFSLGYHRHRGHSHRTHLDGSVGSGGRLCRVSRHYSSRLDDSGIQPQRHETVERHHCGGVPHRPTVERLSLVAKEPSHCRVLRGATLGHGRR